MIIENFIDVSKILNEIYLKIQKKKIEKNEKNLIIFKIIANHYLTHYQKQSLSVSNKKPAETTFAATTREDRE